MPIDVFLRRTQTRHFQRLARKGLTMNILIIGGTGFVGRHLVDAALARGHSVTLFNRGQTGANLFPQVETIIGDRETDLHRLAGRRWDAVVDTCGYVPRVVRLSAEALSGSVGHYVFISSTAMYADFNQVGLDETYPGALLDDETNEDVGSNYGALKTLCEKVAEAVFPGRALIVRPHFVAGPHDPTERFTYWPVRVTRGGIVLAPGSPQEPSQFIDVRDMAEWMTRAIEAGITGPFIAAGPEDNYTFGQFLETCKQVTGSDARFLWVPADQMASHDLSAYQDFPLWLPPEFGPGWGRMSMAKARATGLTNRPVDETVRDTLDWVKTLPADYRWQVGPTPEREAGVIAALTGTNPDL
jgi:2'-hydroxyisoflavone reductase